jgi:hypothetical protein
MKYDQFQSCWLQAGHDQRRLLLASLAHELTIISRASYDFADAQRQRAWMRSANEVQHAVLGLLRSRWSSHGDTAPEELAWLFEPRVDEAFQEYLQCALDRVFKSTA